MANRSYLIGTNSSDAGSSYDADRDILAAATSLIPLLWLSLFEECDLQHVIEDGKRIPALLTTSQLAKDRLKARQAILKRALPENSKQLTEWRKLISRIPHQFITVDGLEVWGLDPEFYEASLVPAIRWFSSNDADDLEALQSLSQTQSGLTKKSIKFPWHSKHNLHGHQWVREVPWDDADDEPPSSAPAPANPMLEPVDPELFERYPQLQRFWDLDWLSHAGKPLRSKWAAGTADSLIASFFLAEDWRWGMIKVRLGSQFMLDWVRDNITTDAESYCEEWRTGLHIASQKIYYQRVLPKFLRAIRGYRLSGLSTRFVWDITHITMEHELVKKGMPEGFCSQLWEVYEAGHYPYNCEEDFPGGKLLVY